MPGVLEMTREVVNKQWHKVSAAWVCVFQNPVLNNACGDFKATPAVMKSWEYFLYFH